MKELLLLGATISVGHYSTPTWEPPAAKLEQRLSSWKGRQLTYQGKATVINTLALSQIWHLCHVFVIPGWAIKHINPSGVSSGPAAKSLLLGAPCVCLKLKVAFV